MISLIARLTIREGKEDQAIDLIKGLMDHVVKEEGTLYYTLNRSNKTPDQLIIMERYTGKAALDHHSQTDYFQQFNREIAGLLAAKPAIEVMEEIHSI
ncbi:MAG: putative quinol monooxygenase [Deltaproteobacteria bacterium]|jgi:quinol monooxygenase YgiN